MRKFLVKAIPIATLVIFIVLMQSGYFLKRPLGNDDNIPESLEILMDNVQNERWDVVREKIKQLDELWKSIVARIQFSSEREEIKSFSMNLARFRGAMRMKDRNSAVVELNEALEHWKQLGK